MNYDKLPEGLRRGAKLYLEHGIEPGSFLRACFENDLVEAFARADHVNTARMRDIADWMYNECPMTARGNPKNVAAWIDHKGAEVFT